MWAINLCVFTFVLCTQLSQLCVAFGHCSFRRPTLQLRAEEKNDFVFLGGMSIAAYSKIVQGNDIDTRNYIDAVNNLLSANQIKMQQLEASLLSARAETMDAIGKYLRRRIKYLRQRIKRSS